MRSLKSTISLLVLHLPLFVLLRRGWLYCNHCSSFNLPQPRTWFSWTSYFVWPCKSNIQDHFTGRLLNVKGGTWLCLTWAGEWPYNYTSYRLCATVKLNSTPLWIIWCSRMTSKDLCLRMKGIHHIHSFAAWGCVCVCMYPLTETVDDPSLGVWYTDLCFFQTMVPKARATSPRPWMSPASLTGCPLVHKLYMDFSTSAHITVDHHM